MTPSRSAKGWRVGTWQMPSTGCSPRTSAAASLTARVEDLRAEQNRASKSIGGAQGEEKQRLIDEVSTVSAK